MEAAVVSGFIDLFVCFQKMRGIQLIPVAFRFFVVLEIQCAYAAERGFGLLQNIRLVADVRGQAEMMPRRDVSQCANR